MNVVKEKFMKRVMSLEDGPGPSSKRFVLVIAGIALSISTIILACAAAYGIPVGNELWAVTTTLAALAGVSYVAKKEGSEIQTTTLNEDSR